MADQLPPHAAMLDPVLLRNQTAALAERLAVFNQAAGRDVHRLNKTFPHLPLSWHAAWMEHLRDLDFLPLLLKS